LIIFDFIAEIFCIVLKLGPSPTRGEQILRALERRALGSVFRPERVEIVGERRGASKFVLQFDY
jgi:hypothetical protein